MTQALYAHMNNKRKREKKKRDFIAMNANIKRPDSFDGPSTKVRTYSPIYLGSRDQEDCGSIEVSPGKKS
jgi:hypothetical protein